MDDIAALLRRYALGTWRRRWIALGAAWLFCLGGWAGVMSLPPTYEASAQVYVAADPVLTPLLHGIAIGGGISSEVALLQRTLLSRPNLEALIAKADLLRNNDTVTAREAMVRSLAKTVRIVPETDSLLTIAYRDADPRRAYAIVQSLLSIFIERATGSDQSDVANAQRFLESQIALYRQRLRDTEQRRAAFLAKYIQLLPGADGSVSQFDAARAQVRSLEGQLADAKARSALLQSQLAETPPMVETGQGSGGSSGNAGALAAAEQNLTELRQRYTDAYPGVIDARKLVAALAAQAAGKGAVAMPVVRESLPNPVYDDLKLQLIDATTSALSLERELKAAVTERDRLASLARSQPGLQAEFINLDRNYEVLRRQYQDLLTRQESMQITAAANIDANRVQLQVVNPPQMPTIPVAPPRELLLAAVLLAGLGGGVGLALLLAHADSCSYTLQDLRSIGVPVAGGISLRRTSAQRPRALPALAFGAGLFLLVFTFAGLVVGAGHLAGLA
ncbi:MAG TPA: XrtA system polysaccharide chain length determinant [Acetobacteraceae bacterium]|nr:XrtA system polysaccharide chain length determinant [Acetobacteraceae bacterium]